MKINSIYLYSAAGALFILILMSFFFHRNSSQFFNTKNPNTQFSIEYHNGACNITSRVRGEHGELTLPAYSNTVDLTQHTGKQKGVTGKVMYVKNTKELWESTNCKLPKNQTIIAKAVRAPNFFSHFTTAFIVESIATSSAFHLTK